MSMSKSQMKRLIIQRRSGWYCNYCGFLNQSDEDICTCGHKRLLDLVEEQTAEDERVTAFIKELAESEGYVTSGNTKSGSEAYDQFTTVVCALLKKHNLIF